MYVCIWSISSAYSYLDTREMSHEEDLVCVYILAGFNAAPETIRFYCLCKVLHEDNIMYV